MRYRVRMQVDAVGRALERLVDEGFLQANGTGEQRRYRLIRR